MSKLKNDAVAGPGLGIPCYLHVNNAYDDLPRYQKRKMADKESIKKTVQSYRRKEKKSMLQPKTLADMVIPDDCKYRDSSNRTVFGTKKNPS